MDKFLVELLMDLYEVSMKTSGIDEAELDSWFLNEDGTYMEDEEYIKEHKEDFMEQEYIDSISVTILDEDEDEEFTYEDILKRLVYKFIIINYSDPKVKPVIDFFRKAPLKSISELFEENLNFSRSLISSFINSITEEEKYNTNLEMINKNKDTILKQYELQKKEDKIEIETINSKLRNVIVNLYDYFISNGIKNEEEIAENIRAYFLRDFDPLGELDKMGYSVTEKQMLKYYILKLMYLDLYEDSLNTPCILPSNMRESFFSILPKMALSNKNGIILPIDNDCFAYLLKWFKLLNEIEDKKKANRTRTIHDEKSLKLVKEYYPLFFLDAIDYQ